ncbi:NUDIX hydrolase [Streptomyces virginiae]|uniref:NUDIX hydrolase n=1 Tax=Streptomyces virginiae TaxID=1961 RepID=UPI0036A14894
MTPTRSALRYLVHEYLERYPAERDRLAPLTTALDEPGDPTSRATLPGHITCSAVVIDRDQHVLHIHHRATGLALVPGGHLEPSDRTLIAAAVRELHEEAGIAVGDLSLTTQLLDSPLDIDIHDIAPRPAKGEGEHQHYDVRFVFYLRREAPPIFLQDEEVSGAQWLPFDQVTSPALRAKLIDTPLDGPSVNTVCA